MPWTAVDNPPLPTDFRWLEHFHRGDRATLEQCYRSHFAIVKRAVGAIVDGADQDTVIHELFSSLIAREDLRRNYRGGSFAAWLSTVARNRAIDYRRRLGREIALQDNTGASVDASWEQATHARLLIDQFRDTQLPAEWVGVFELRFLWQMPQREAARQLGLRRTTLAYRELRIRALLRDFLLNGDEP